MMGYLSIAVLYCNLLLIQNICKDQSQYYMDGIHMKVLDPVHENLIHMPSLDEWQVANYLILQVAKVMSFKLNTIRWSC